MPTIKEDILHELQCSPKSRQYLLMHINTSRSGLRARITELRKKGYDIKNNGNVYILYNNRAKEKKSIEDIIIDYIQQNNLFRRTLSISSISLLLHIPPDDIKKGIAMLFKYYKVLQMSSDTFKIENNK